MKIACCQFTPVWADPKASMAIVDQLLSCYGPDDIDLLVLPEMAFTGYVFNNRDEIQALLEDAQNGVTVTWAKRQAIRLQSFVVVGYPQSPGYNSLCCVNPQGHLVQTYQKSFLFQQDEVWAAEGPGFVSIEMEGLGKVGFGICMDINPYQFKAPFDAYEFANFHLDQGTQIIVCCMAWLQSSQVMDTISYWAQRLAPLILQSKRRVCVVACNRTGSERGSTFAGGSSVLELGHNVPRLLDHMDASDRGVMVVDVAKQI
ncbi:N-terminal asparagine amidohydrolase-like protein [Fennellomyces sp. T-0311]|nr:N-terminal asparagine amidohydrolase-like protein [Fennellomyces sp. T-0311]